MAIENVKNIVDRQLRLLLVYNIYRVLSVLLFILIYYYNPIKGNSKLLFFSVLTLYFFCSSLFLYRGLTRLLHFERYVFICGTVDVIAVATLLTLIANLHSGQGVLLNATVASLSILVPGRLAIFFAALASCLLLCGNLLEFIINSQIDIGTIYYSGIYGAGFFATALTAWYLANWVRLSERYARERSDELMGMQKINEYIVERLHSGVIYVDEQKNIKLINSAAKQFFNQDANPVVSLHQISNLLTERFDDFMAKTKKSERIAQTIIKNPYLRVHFFATNVANRPAVLIILEDMTYITQQAQQLKLAALGRFSASIAHELRNPLGAIAHAGQLLGERGGLSAEDERLKQLILNNCTRMNEVIKNVLQLSRREKSQPQVNQVVPFLEQFRQNFCHNNTCNLIIKVTNKKLSMVFDRSQLEQVLVILCDNAMKHGADKHGIVTIRIRAKRVLHKTCIIVSDEGSGIAPDYRDTIFEPFFTTLRHGTGMGLFIAKDLCEINQAQLALLQTERGCAFAITQSPSHELLL